VPLALRILGRVRSADGWSMKDIRVELEAPSRVRPGDPVPFVLRLTNDGAHETDATFVGRSITFDVIVADAHGREVWRRLDGMVVPMILQLRTLAPGEVVELANVWDQHHRDGTPLPPGEYVVIGEIPTGDADPLRAPAVRLRIDAR
jgi:hypothetical protein